MDRVTGQLKRVKSVITYSRMLGLDMEGLTQIGPTAATILREVQRRMVFRCLAERVGLTLADEEFFELIAFNEARFE